MYALAGTGRLLRLGLRRNRVWAPAWVAGLAGFVLLMGGSIVKLYPDPESRIGGARTIDNPGSTFLIGRRLGPDDYPWGAGIAHQTLVLTAIGFALLAILTMTRHTRAEEDSGLTEVVRAGRVGRFAPLVTACILSILNVLLAAAAVTVVLVGMRAESVSTRGALVFAGAVGGVGVFFVGLAAVLAQLGRTARSVSGAGIGVLAAAYLLRGLADVQDSGAWRFSPLGWSQRTAPFVADRWWPVLLLVGTGLSLALLGAVLAGRRDSQAGLLPEVRGAGRARPLTVTPLGLALRLQRTHLAVWTVALFLVGLVYGPVLSDADTFLSQMPSLNQISPKAAAAGGMKMFASIIVGLTALLACIPGIQVLTTAVSDERRGRAALLLAGLSRTRWFAAACAVAVLCTLVPSLAFGAGFGLAAARARGDGELVAEMVKATLGYAPAQLVLLALTALLVGALPRLTSLAWLAWLHSVVVYFFADLMDWPVWVASPSPFHHVAPRPASGDDHQALVVLACVALALLVAGGLSYRKRPLS